LRPERLEILDDKYFARARYNMVLHQLVPNGILDESIIETMRSVPRHSFIKSKHFQMAYTDGILPLMDTEIFADGNRYLLPPLVFAKMLQAGEINSESVVLDVACGTGYSSVVISNIAKKVVAIEEDRKLLKLASDDVEMMHNADNIMFDTPIGFESNADATKFDLVFVNGILNDIPKFFKDRLKENGRLILIEKQNHFAQAIKYTKHGDKLSKEELFDVDADDRLNIYMELK
jgi:protein-L-isoaspartate(D-aspartate) O-methyltransferase